jgi:hypothetical protein
MYHEDDEINDLHEFMREEAKARKEQEQYEENTNQQEKE